VAAWAEKRIAQAVQNGWGNVEWFQEHQEGFMMSSERVQDQKQGTFRPGAQRRFSLAIHQVDRLQVNRPAGRAQVEFQFRLKTLPVEKHLESQIDGADPGIELAVLEDHTQRRGVPVADQDVTLGQGTLIGRYHPDRVQAGLAQEQRGTG